MYIGLIQNAGLLLSLSILYSLLTRTSKIGKTWGKVLSGILFGGMAVIGMTLPIHYSAGIIYDGRSIILGMAGLFGGGIASAISILIAGVYRIQIGGAGVWAGLGTIIGCAMTGLAFRRFYGNRPEELGTLPLYGVGISVHVVMLACQLLIQPWGIGVIVIQKIWLPVMLVFPAATVLMGVLLRSEKNRIKTERNLRKSEERFRNIYENVSIGMYQATPDGRLLMANEALVRMLGYSSFEEMAEWNLKSDPVYVDGESRKRFEKLMEENGSVVGLEEQWKKRDGTTLWVREGARLVRGENGKPVHYEGTAEDITERKLMEIERDQLQEQLLQSQKIESVGRLAGGVAHDYNNMLGVILGRAEMVLSKMDKDDPNRGSIEAIMRAGKRSADLTRQLLAFARKQTIQPRVMNLNDTIEHMLKMLRQIIGENIDLNWQPGNGLWAVEMDPVQVDQILANLCVNARDALSERGTITIETANKVIDESYCTTHPESIPGRYVMLTVSDDGFGMDEETRSHIFDPFFTTKGVGEGTGLGLSTVYGIVKQNNGFINVYSEPDEGSVFRIYIPLSEEAAIGETEGKLTELPRGNGERVLLVEDEGVLLEMAKTMLEELGYQVQIASLPTEALSFLQEDTCSIDLLITDVVMPGMSGKELAEEVRKLCDGVKVLFMSGYTANAIAHQGVLDKGVAFIQKPFSLRELAQKTEEILNLP
jgi:two-component system, cell cycle sensor histidine kinase and response regulator CckA